MFLQQRDVLDFVKVLTNLIGTRTWEASEKDGAVCSCLYTETVAGKWGSPVSRCRLRFMHAFCACTETCPCYPGNILKAENILFQFFFFNSLAVLICLSGVSRRDNQLDVIGLKRTCLKHEMKCGTLPETMLSERPCKWKVSVGNS